MKEIELCSTEDCSTEVYARGFCRRCYQSARKSGALKKVNYDEIKCSITGCNITSRALGYCKPHYARYLRTGHTGNTIIQKGAVILTRPQDNNLLMQDVQANIRKARADRLRARGFVPQP